LGGENQLKNLALVDVAWRQECIYFLYLPIFTGEALGQNSKAVATLHGMQVRRALSPPNPFSPAPTRSAPKIRD